MTISELLAAIPDLTTKQAVLVAVLVARAHWTPTDSTCFGEKAHDTIFRLAAEIDEGGAQ